MHDDYRFLDPWTLLLPQEGRSVLALAGSGGKTTLLRRLAEHFRAERRTVLWSQTVDHPAPVDVPTLAPGDPTLADAIRQHGTVHLGIPGSEGCVRAVSPADLDAAWETSAADVLLVECHARTGTPLRDDGTDPVWPRRCDRAFLVAQMAAVGRPVSEATVAGRSTPPPAEDGGPVRITSDDLVDRYLADRGLLADLPPSGLPIPFLTGFGGYRDMDGMFALVAALWEHPRVRAVCLGELLGDERRDAADRRGLPPGAPDPTSSERVYALYPAHLDDA